MLFCLNLVLKQAIYITPTSLNNLNRLIQTLPKY